MHVEDHPLEYADFEGVIPAGQYGAGTVEIWDRGTYDLLEEKRDGGLTVRLHGERLDGEWTLVPAALDGDAKNWLLLRKDAGDGAGGRYEPMLSTTAETPPVGEGWVFEPKWDGYRAIVTVSGGEVTLTSRNGNDLTERFRDVARAAALAITTSDAVLDGEICALDEQGRSRFSLLQEGAGTPVLVLFDLLELESESLLDLPLAERRTRLEKIVGPGAGVLVSPQFDDGAALLAAARQQGLEGVVAKKTRLAVQARADDRPTGTRSSCGGRRRSSSPATRVARDAGREGSAPSSPGYTRRVGCAGPGTSGRASPITRSSGSARCSSRSSAPIRPSRTFRRCRASGGSDVTWVEPRLVAEVEFAEWTHEGRLRAPVVPADPRGPGGAGRASRARAASGAS